VPPQVRRYSCSAILLAAVCVLALSACGGGGAATGRHAQPKVASALPRVELAFARCVRAHGVPDFPNPNGHGQLPYARLRTIHNGPLGHKESTALGSCAHLLAHTHGRVTARLIAIPPRELLHFSACMRAHGLSAYAGPGAGKKAQLRNVTYIRAHRGAFGRAFSACRKLIPIPRP
jgi:hypothetical protein